MAIMGSRNPEIPRLNNLGSLANAYTNFISKPEFENTRNILQGYVDEQEKEALKAQEQERYNQEFGLKQAAANREQSKYDRELNTDKALVEYQSMLRRAAQGGAMSDQDGIRLGNEYDKLVGTVGEEKAAEIINARAQELGQQDAKKAQSDPFYASKLVQGVTIDGNRFGSIDPTKLINMQSSLENEFNDRGESLRTFNADQAYKNKSLALDREKMGLQKAQYDLQNKRYNEELENKTREQLLKNQNLNTYIQQMIALDKDPRGYTYDQMKSIVDKAGETKDFGFEEKVFNTGKKDENGKEITETKTVLTAKDKPISDKDIAKKEQENFDAFTKLLNSPNFKSLAEADTFGNKSTEIVDIARLAKIPANIVESVLANKTAKNASEWTKESLTYDDFNKFSVQDPNNKEKWYSLGDYLEKLQENPQFLEQVASGVTAPFLIHKSEQQIAEEIAKQKKENDNFNPYKIR